MLKLTAKIVTVALALVGLGALGGWLYDYKHPVVGPTLD